ncbi:MAG TPA: hypothetical protein VH234_04660 [Candidatus Saccharimonadales bacterium]|jgi:antitoxin component of RelBE/YafQ-DinJ toxin-antitoxin module|nr:hypothetical protein [Candidatus Saccharimonadales bacterium]
MNSAVINFKTDPKTKKALQQYAKELGTTTSSLLNANIRQMLRSRKVILTDSLEPNAELEKVLRAVEDDIKHNRIGPPMNREEALDHLRSMM